jgi:hypothetical protein
MNDQMIEMVKLPVLGIGTDESVNHVSWKRLE